MARVDAFLKLGRNQGCSDIHLTIDSPPLVRRNGELQVVKYRELSGEELENLIFEILSDDQLKEFQDGHDLDFSYASDDAGRFRVSIFKKVGGIGAAFRVIPDKTPLLSNLGLPQVVHNFLNEHQGLILVTGSTGTGKSTTLAAMINEMNNRRRLNIITLEDPIEHVHESKMSLVVQREIGTHVDNYTEGLRAALREDPDVILIGELREPETILMAMTAAETGHLVLGTLHTTSASKSIDRIIDAMPTELKQQAANFLAQHLRGVISQKLLKTTDGHNRKAITEIFINTPAISNLIAGGKVFQIPAMIQTGKEKGMQLMDQALMEAVVKKQIDPDDAYIHAVDKQQFQRFVTNSDLLPQTNAALS
ncbi:MAG: PilT/PilU family type 4a pilus ATPase [Gammaproteobacteria bacterium]|nr:PilT/PilU family type 4a pilus ATPase [Gammaproteobacteria bacterium]MDH5799358.1 PilT/PilU family type 4a pilus ATPase [Gammaproteobacteria bacterium]